MSSQDSVPFDDSAILDRALAEYWQRVEEGESVDLEQFLAKHSDYRDQLEAVIRADASLARMPLPASLLENTVTLIAEAPDAKLPDSDAGEQRIPGPGVRIGDFRLIREIGRGGMGVVYEANQLSLDRKVALKVLPAEAMLDASRLARFRNETRAVAQLQHPNIVPIYAVGEDNGTLFFAMQLIRGQNLAAVVRGIQQRVDARSGVRATPNIASAETAAQDGKTREDKHPESVAGLSAGDYPDASRSRRYPNESIKYFRSVARVGVEAASALDCVHTAGIRHRDVKPSNLMVDADGHVWITDFGLAQIETTETLTRTGDLLGTLRYMSPEQASGRKGLVDHRTDIYSLGVTLYELLSLKHAVAGDTPPEILRNVALANPVPLRKQNPRIPADLEVVVNKAISRDPRDRYDTIAELAEDLQRFTEGRPILARKPTFGRRCRDWVRRHPQLVTTSFVGGLITMLVSLVALAFIFNSLLGEQEARQKAEVALGESEGSRLLANSALLLEHNPGLAMLLAIEGAQRAPGIEANSALLAAIDANHERATIKTAEVLQHVAASPDGRTLAACQRVPHDQPPPPVLIYDLEQRTVARELATESRFTSAAFDSTGRYLLLAGDPRGEDTTPPTLYDTSTWNRVRTFTEYSLAEAQTNVFSPDGRYLVLCGLKSGASIIAVESGIVEVPLQDDERKVVRTGFDQTGQRVGIAFADGGVATWNRMTGKIERRIPPTRAKMSTPTNVRFLPGGGYLAVARPTGTHFYSLKDNPPGKAHFSHAELRAVSDKAPIAVLAARGYSVATVIDTISLERICAIEGRGRILSASLKDKSVLLHCAGADAEPLTIHDATTGDRLADLKGHLGHLASVTFGSTSESIITSGLDNTLRVWNRESGRQKRSFGTVDTLGPRNLAHQTAGFRYSSKGKFLCLARPMQASTELREIGRSKSVAPKLTGQCTHQEIQPNCETLITYDGSTVYAWDAKTNRLLRSTSVPEKVLSTFATHSRAVVLTRSGQAWLWDYNASRLTRLTNIAEPAVAAVADSQVALGTASGTISVLNAITGLTVSTLKHSAGIKVIRFSPDGQRLMIVDSNGAIYIWRLNRADDPIEVIPETHVAHDALFVADGKFAVTFASTIKQPVGVWDTETGERIETRDYGKMRRIDALGSNVLLCPVTAPPVLWNVQTDAIHTLGNLPCQFATLHEDTVVTVHENTRTERNDDPTVATLQVWKASTGDLSRKEQLDFRPASMNRTPTGKRFAITRDEYSVDVLSESRGEHIASLSGHPERVVTVSHNETTGGLLTISADGKLRFFDTQGRLSNLIRGHDQRITAADISPDALLSVTGDTSGRLVLWDNTRQQRERDLHKHANEVRSIRFHHNHYVVTIDANGLVQVLDLRTKEPFIYEHENGVFFAELSADGRSLLVHTGGRRQSETKPRGVSVVNIISGEVRSIAARDAMSCRFSPAGSHILIVWANGVVKIYDAETLEVRHSISVPGARVRAASFDSGQDRIITLHEAGLSTWSLENGRELFRTAYGSEFLRRASSGLLRTWQPWSPSGDYVLLQQGGELLRYPLQPFETAKMAAPRVLLPEEAARYLRN